MRLSECAARVSKFLHEPAWLLQARLSAVALLEKRHGTAEISGFRMEKGRMRLGVEAEGGAAVLPISEALFRGDALREQIARPLCGKEPDSYLLSLALFTDAAVVAAPGARKSRISLEIAGKPPEHFALFYLFADGSDASVIEKSAFAASAGECRALFLGNGSRVQFCSLQQNGAKSSCSVGMVARQASDSSLKFLNTNLGSAEKRDSFAFLQEGRGSRCEHFEATLARGKQKVFKDSQHFHMAPGTYSRSFFKYAATDFSRVDVDGRVTIEEGAPGSDTHLLAKSLLLSENSSSRIVPQLFVHNEKVAAGHGSAMAPIPQEELFYLRSRGIGESESKLLVLQGFLHDALAKSGIEPPVLSAVEEELEKDALAVFPRD